MSKFSVWIDDVNASVNCQSADVFASDSQRAKGFQAGTGASSIRVNTALRQANLIGVALVNALEIPDTYSATSAVTDISDWFKSTNLFKLSRVFEIGLPGAENKIKESLQPETDNTVDLGIDSKRFRNVWAKSITADAVYGKTYATFSPIGLMNSMYIREIGPFNEVIQKRTMTQIPIKLYDGELYLFEYEILDDSDSFLEGRYIDIVRILRGHSTHFGYKTFANGSSNLNYSFVMDCLYTESDTQGSLSIRYSLYGDHSSSLTVTLKNIYVIKES